MKNKEEAKDDHGELRLVGGMYATGVENPDLDAMLPTSMAHWHEHVNMFADTDDPRAIWDADDDNITRR